MSAVVLTLFALTGVPELIFAESEVAFRLPPGCKAVEVAGGSEGLSYACGETITLSLEEGVLDLDERVGEELRILEEQADGVMLSGPFQTMLGGGHDGIIAELSGVRDGRVALVTLTALRTSAGQTLARVETNYSPLKTDHLRLQQQLVASVWSGADRRTTVRIRGAELPPMCRPIEATEFSYRVPGERSRVGVEPEELEVAEIRRRRDGLSVHFATRRWPLYDIALGSPPVGMRKSDVLITLLLEKPVLGSNPAERGRIEVVRPKTQTPIVPDVETSRIEISHLTDEVVCGEFVVRDRMGNRVSGTFGGRW